MRRLHRRAGRHCDAPAAATHIVRAIRRRHPVAYDTFDRPDPLQNPRERPVTLETLSTAGSRTGLRALARACSEPGAGSTMAPSASISALLPRRHLPLHTPRTQCRAFLRLWTPASQPSWPPPIGPPSPPRPPTPAKPSRDGLLGGCGGVISAAPVAGVVSVLLHTMVCPLSGTTLATGRRSPWPWSSSRWASPRCPW